MLYYGLSRYRHWRIVFPIGDYWRHRDIENKPATARGEAGDDATKGGWGVNNDTTVYLLMGSMDTRP